MANGERGKMPHHAVLRVGEEWWIKHEIVTPQHHNMGVMIVLEKVKEQLAAIHTHVQVWLVISLYNGPNY